MLGLVLATRKERVTGGEPRLGDPGRDRLACLLHEFEAHRLLGLLLHEGGP